MNHEIPIEVSRLLDQMLQKSANHRPASSLQLRDAMRDLQQSDVRLSKPNKKRGIVMKLALALVGIVAVAVLVFAVVPYALLKFQTMAPLSGIPRHPTRLESTSPWFVNKSDMLSSQRSNYFREIAPINRLADQVVTFKGIDELSSQSDRLHRYIDTSLSQFNVDAQSDTSNFAPNISRDMTDLEQEIDQYSIGLFSK